MSTPGPVGYLVSAIEKWPLKQGIAAKKTGKLYDVNLRQTIDPPGDTNCKKLFTKAFTAIREKKESEYDALFASIMKSCIDGAHAFYLPLGLYGTRDVIVDILYHVFNSRDISGLEAKIRPTSKVVVKPPAKKTVQKGIAPEGALGRIFEQNKDRVSTLLESSGIQIEVFKATHACPGTTKAFNVAKKEYNGNKFVWPSADDEHSEDDVNRLIDRYIEYHESKKKEGAPASRARIGSTSVSRATTTTFVTKDTKKLFERYKEGLKAKAASATASVRAEVQRGKPAEKVEPALIEEDEDEDEDGDGDDDEGADVVEEEGSELLVPDEDEDGGDEDGDEGDAEPDLSSGGDSDGESVSE